VDGLGWKRVAGLAFEACAGVEEVLLTGLLRPREGRGRDGGEASK